jgi:hypothetical protein
MVTQVAESTAFDIDFSEIRQVRPRSLVVSSRRIQERPPGVALQSRSASRPGRTRSSFPRYSSATAAPETRPGGG